MKIKDIQKYRSIYKASRPVSPEADENFIGNYYLGKDTKKKYGWFSIYHGDKDGYGDPIVGIENFLQSFLDMAKDGQAVYEFLQNAVDAKSTHYTMVWGQDEVDGNQYLLVANNGEMFNSNSIRSILNVGSSTKTADSQTIGKFGIGFKLAHRLVGKDNGLQELINEHSGPLLFSWENYELASLAEGAVPIPTDISTSFDKKGDIVVDDNNPWLFKILITCFPCLPENEQVVELPRMANGEQAKSAPFSKAEYEVLARWVKKNQNILNKDTYSKGALFFIKLGAGKETELAENNLKEGVKFALAILRETAETALEKGNVLGTVQINDEEPITYPDLEYVKLSVDKVKEKDTYAYVRFGIDNYADLTSEQKRRIDAEANIEALFGFRRHTEIRDYFKGAPNLYLYFPLSEEVHNFNYILHSNAFYKGSSRTFLHKGSSKEDGINERLLKTIVAKIDNELNRLSSSPNKAEQKLFLDFYSALLTSGKSTNQDRLWIDDPYISKVNEILKKYIPIRTSSNSDHFTIAAHPENVFIKKSKIAVDTKAWGLTDINWFYWGEEAELTILLNATGKLQIEAYDIFNLLQESDIGPFMNNWIGGDALRIETILNELRHYSTDVVSFDAIKPQLFDLKILEFSNGEILSVNQFEEKESEGYFLLHNTLNNIKDLLQKLNLITTKLNLDDYRFIDNYRNYFKQSTKHRGFTDLTIHFSSTVKNEDLKKLTTEEKFRIFSAVHSFKKDDIVERIKELKLLCNNLGVPVRFKNLFSDSKIAWLNKFCVSTSEYNAEYKKYLLDKPEDVYEGIVYPFWEAVAAYIALNSPKAREVLDDVVTSFEKSSWLEKGKFLLHTKNQIIFQSEVIEADNIYFNQELSSLSADEYKSIQTTVFKYYGMYLPDAYLVNYLDKQPFSFSLSPFLPTIDDTESSFDDVRDLLLFSKICNIDFFSGNCIVIDEGAYRIDSSSGRKQIATAKQKIVKYVETYYSEEYALIPDEFSTAKNKILLSDTKLVEHLIERFEEGDLNQELDLIEIVLHEGYDAEKALLQKLTYTNLDATWTEERQNELYIKILHDVIQGDLTPEEIDLIHNKISIAKDDQEIIIGKIDSAHDTIEVSRDGKKITLSQSQILNLENADNIKLIQTFHDEARKRDWVNQSTADKLFKISNAGITDELVARFIENLSDNQLENSHQVLFVLLSGKFGKEEYGEYLVRSNDDKWYGLAGTLTFHAEKNLAHINPVYIVNEYYSDLQSLLQLGDLDVFNFGKDEDDLIMSGFLFVKGCNPAILKSSLAMEDRLDYLYSGWADLPPLMREHKHSGDWDEYLEIVPNQFVLNGVHVKDEELPEEFMLWHNKERRKDDFFRAIGVYVNDNPLERLRKFLIGVNKTLPADFEIGKLNNVLLLNTLNGLAGDFVNLNNKPFIFKDDNKLQIRTVEKIIDHLYESKEPSIPLLIFHSIDSYKIVKTADETIYKIDDEFYQKIEGLQKKNLTILYRNFKIVKQSAVLDNQILDEIVEFTFNKTFVDTDYQAEHDEPFYKYWSEERNILLIKKSEITFRLNFEIENDVYDLGIIREGHYYVEENDDGSVIYYDQQLKWEGLRSCLVDDGLDEISEALNDLIKARDKTLASFYHAITSSGRGDFDDEDARRILENLKKRNIEEDRKEIVSDIVDLQNNGYRYSYNWFERYIRYLLSFENLAETTSQKSISFQKIKTYLINETVSPRYFILESANSLIPVNIEAFEGFNISLVFHNQRKENIVVEGVCKKGQDLLIYVPQGIDDKIVNNFANVVSVNINFSPVLDLVKRLYNAFTNTSIILPWEDVEKALHPIHFIYGPPGTGKTTKICKMIEDEGIKKPSLRVLILVPTNKAGDVIAKRLLSKESYLSVVRIGSATDPDLEILDEEIYQSSLDDSQLGKYNVVITTIHRLPYYQINNDNGAYYHLFGEQVKWDYIIFDESSMISLPYFVFAINALSRHNKRTKMIVAGDPKQIPPVMDTSDGDLEQLELDEESVYRMMNIRSFKPAEQKLRRVDSIENLTVQYRSIEKIGKLFSEFSYDDLLTHGRDLKQKPIKHLPKSFLKELQKPISIIDFPINLDVSVLAPKKLLFSSYHIHAAILTVELIKHLDTCNHDKKQYTIGVVSPYKAQAMIMNKLITSSGVSDSINVHCDTVHGFQGDECDIIIFVVNPNQPYYTGHNKALLSKEYIYNVANSRAKDYLWILCPLTNISNNPHTSRIYEIAKKNREYSLVTSKKIEKELFGEGDYIVNHSYLTGHDTINVFGQVDMNYFIKAGNTAIDIQLKNGNA